MNIFLSSTCYDLKDLRAEVEQFIRDKGHFPLMSDRDNFPMVPGKHRHDVCLENIYICNLLIVVISGRYGAPYYKDPNKSITHAEYDEAVKLDKEIRVFIRKEVFDERLCYLKNNTTERPYNPVFADNNKVFDFIDIIQKDKKGFYIQFFNDSIHLKSLLKQILDSEFITEHKHIDLKGIGIPLESLSSVAVNYITSNYGIKMGELVTEDVLKKAMDSIPEKTTQFGELLGFEQIPSGSDYVYFTPLRNSGQEGEIIVGISPTAFGTAVRKEIGELLKSSGSINVNIK